MTAYMCRDALFRWLQIQKMVISGGDYRPDVLKPKEVVSLLLDDDEMEKKCKRLSLANRGNIVVHTCTQMYIHVHTCNYICTACVHSFQ